MIAPPVFPSAFQLTPLNDSQTLSASQFVDPRFESKGSDIGLPLPRITCLMNSIFAMRSLVLEDFTSSMNQFTSKMYSYPEVQIIILPAREGSTIELRFASFVDIRFTLTWEKDTVGYVLFKRPPPSPTRTQTPVPIVHEVQIPHDANNTVKFNAKDDSTESNTNLNDGHWKVDLDIRPYLVPKPDFFVAVLGAMTLLARFPASDAAIRHTFGLSLIRYTFGWLPTASTEPPAAGKPFLRYEYIIKALADLSRVLLQGEQGFREVGLNFLFDSELIGKAALVRRSSRQAKL